MADEAVIDQDELLEQAAFDEGAASLLTPDAAPAAEAKPVDAVAEPKPAPAPKPVAPGPKYVRITEDQLKGFNSVAEKMTALETQMSKAFGTIGNVQQIVTKLQAATPVGLKVEIPKDAFTEMEKDFPELAAHSRKALEATLKGLSGTGTAPASDAEATARQISERVREATLTAQAEVLEDFYPDWKKIVGAVDLTKGEKPDPKNPFRLWLKTQPDAYQDKINNTNSAAIISRAIGKFEAARKAAPARPQPKPVAPKQAARIARIAAAVKPKGDGGQPGPRKTVDDEFNEGFRSG